MQLQFEEMNDRVTNVLKDGERVGVITERNGQIGYRIFGEPVGGTCQSQEDARKQIEAHFN